MTVNSNEIAKEIVSTGALELDCMLRAGRYAEAASMALACAHCECLAVAVRPGFEAPAER